VSLLLPMRDMNLFLAEQRKSIVDKCAEIKASCPEEVGICIYEGGARCWVWVYEVFF